LPIRATSAGGGDSTVKDLLAFANALTHEKLLDAEHTKLLTTSKVDTPNATRIFRTERLCVNSCVGGHTWRLTYL